MIICTGDALGMDKGIDSTVVVRIPN